MTTEQSLIDSGAWISECEKYRYRLWRTWGIGSCCTFIMLNPSTADVKTNDATIRRCINFAKDFGHAGLIVLNLFSYRCTDPRLLADTTDPVGDFGDNVFNGICSADVVVAAWGSHKMVKGRDKYVYDSLTQNVKKVYCLGLTKQGYPKHPLYVPKDTKLIDFTLNTEQQ